MNKSDLNTSMLYKIRDGRLCVLLNGENNEMMFFNKNNINKGVGDVMFFDNLNDKLMLTENNITSYDIVAIKQCSSNVEVISDVLNDNEPEEWDWVRGEADEDKTMQNKELFIELEQKSKPLQEFLMKYFDPMTKIEIEIGHINVLRSEMGISTEIND